MNDLKDKDFRDRVKKWLLSAIQKELQSFHHILLNIPSVYPAIALEGIKLLALEGKIPFSIYKKAVLEVSGGDGCKIEDFCHELVPIPHPLDYDWRFSEDASNRLLSECSSYITDFECVAFLGTPSVFIKAQNRVPWKLVLIDLNSEFIVLDSHRSNNSGTLIYKLNIFEDSLPPINASAMILDPPWYEEYFKAFLWAAQRMTKIGGILLVSMPPIGTRPSAQHENSIIIDWASQIGLRLIKYEETFLPYIMPPFERNALRAKGIVNVPNNWRRGDLAVFRYENRRLIKRPRIPQNQEKWQEIIIKGVRIRIRENEITEFRDPRLITVIENDILPTVSRRDPRRRLVDVWTSGNRVFKCEGPKTLIRIAETLKGNTTVREIVRNFGYPLNKYQLLAVRNTVGVYAKISDSLIR